MPASRRPLARSDKRRSAVLRRSAVALVVTLGGLACGRRGELLGTILASNNDAASATDAGASLQFAPPTLVAAVSDPQAYDADPSFTGDLLQMFFMSDRTGSKDIWTSRRAQATDPWGAPSIVSALNSPGTDEGPSISLDGSRIWFASDRDSAPRRHIWQSTRATPDGVWAPPTVVAEFASTADDYGPTVDATETTILFGSNRPMAMGYDVFSSTRPSANSRWGAPRLVPGVNGPFDDKDPFVTQGGLIIFFTTTRTGAGDLYWSMRQSTTAPFPPPVPLVDLNSPAYDSDPSLSQDLTYIMFDSQRSGISDIYESHAIR